MGDLEELRSKLLDRIIKSPGPLSSSCWIWTSSLFNKGYGCMQWDGKNQPAHRLSYIAFIGPIPAGLYCLHHCDVRNCINPSHLYTGTGQDNSDDMRRRNRVNPVNGENHGMVVLTKEQVSEIKYLALEGHLTQREIADAYGAAQGQVSNIKLGKNWPHIEPIEPPPPPPPPPPTPIPNFNRRI